MAKFLPDWSNSALDDSEIPWSEREWTRSDTKAIWNEETQSYDFHENRADVYTSQEYPEGNHIALTDWVPISFERMADATTCPFPEFVYDAFQESFGEVPSRPTAVPLNQRIQSNLENIRQKARKDGKIESVEYRRSKRDLETS